MASVFQKLAMQWDIWKGRYTPFFVSEPDDFEACKQLLEVVRKTELNRVSGNNALTSAAFSDEEVSFDLVACRDNTNNKIVGCMRLTEARDLIDIESSKEEYQLNLFESSVIDRLCVYTRLAVAKEFRNSPVALIIMSFSFVDYVEKGGLGILMTCEPNLFHMYKRLGLRPIGQLLNSAYGGYRLPMICLPDKVHFEKVKSPALPFMKAIKWELYDGINNWYLQKVRVTDQVDLGIALYHEEDLVKEAHWQITEGLSPEGVKSFTKNAISIQCKKDDLLMAQEDGGKNIGIVLNGFVLIKIEETLVALLTKGEVFGEMAFLLDQNRTADVIAGSDDTRILLCSKSSFDRIGNAKDKIQIWKNMSTVLAKRILYNNQNLLQIKESG